MMSGYYWEKLPVGCIAMEGVKQREAPVFNSDILYLRKLKKL